MFSLNYYFIYFCIDYSISYSPIKNQDRKRKDISHDYTRENIKELKNNTFNESSNSEVNLDDKDNSNQENVTNSDGTDSDTDSERNVKNEKSYNEPTTIVLDSGITLIFFILNKLFLKYINFLSYDNSN